MGGWGTWDILTRAPDLFAAAIPICGKVDLETAPDLVDLPIWIFHGDRDPKCPVRFSRDMFRAIREAGGRKVRYTEYTGVGHDSWNHVYLDNRALEWIFAQRRP